MSMQEMYELNVGVIEGVKRNLLTIGIFPPIQTKCIMENQRTCIEVQKDFMKELAITLS